MAIKTVSWATCGDILLLLRSPVDIVIADDVAFIKIIPCLHFEDGECGGAGVSQSVFGSLGDVYRIAMIENNQLVLTLHFSLSRKHEPMFAPMVVRLQAEFSSWADVYPFEDMFFTLFQNGVSSPRPLNGSVDCRLGSVL